MNTISLSAGNIIISLNRQLQQVDQRLNNTQQQGQQTGQSIDDSFSGASDSVKNLAAAIGVYRCYGRNGGTCC